jgi:hypothetical protein
MHADFGWLSLAQVKVRTSLLNELGEIGVDDGHGASEGKRVKGKGMVEAVFGETWKVCI